MTHVRSNSARDACGSNGRYDATAPGVTVLYVFREERKNRKVKKIILPDSVYEGSIESTLRATAVYFGHRSFETNPNVHIEHEIEYWVDPWTEVRSGSPHTFVRPKLLTALGTICQQFDLTKVVNMTPDGFAVDTEELLRWSRSSGHRLGLVRQTRNQRMTTMKDTYRLVQRIVLIHRLSELLLVESVWARH